MRAQASLSFFQVQARVVVLDLGRVVQLNVITHLDLAHHFGQRLAERRHGGIVLVSAVAAAGGLPYMANDSATKAYVLNLGEALHVELRARRAFT